MKEWITDPLPAPAPQRTGFCHALGCYRSASAGVCEIHALTPHCIGDRHPALADCGMYMKSIEKIRGLRVQPAACGGSRRNNCPLCALAIVPTPTFLFPAHDRSAVVDRSTIKIERNFGRVEYALVRPVSGGYDRSAQIYEIARVQLEDIGAGERGIQIVGGHGACFWHEGLKIRVVWATRPSHSGLEFGGIREGRSCEWDGSSLVHVGEMGVKISYQRYILVLKFWAFR